MVFCTETDLQNNEQNDIGDAQIFDLINYDITDTIFIDDETTYYIRFDVKAGFYQVVNHIITNHKIKDLQSEIEDLYIHDSLTGLFNQQGFSKYYEKLMKDDSIKYISLALCDLDNLKKINDNCSHTEGDNAIKTVAETLSKAFEDGVYCRFGGDEMLALYPYEVCCESLQNKIDLLLKDYNKTSGKDYEVSASVGVYTSGITDFEEMLKKADKLMLI